MEKIVRPKSPPAEEQLLRKRRPGQEAVMVALKMDGGKYANIIRKAKSLVFPQEFGLQVAKTCYTRKGEMLLELKGLPQKDGDVTDFTNQLHTVLATEAEVKRLQ